MTPDLRQALAQAWRPDAAQGSVERWRQVRSQEHWGSVPADEAMLVRVFGASWYFTRFLFYSGAAAAELIDRPLPLPGSAAGFGRQLRALDCGGDTEALLDALRLRRNEYMLSALVRWLRGELTGAALEAGLSHLAEAVLEAALVAFELSPEALGEEFAVLGMGRLAGDEMSYGSDLDLIFLHPGTGDDVRIPRRVQRFLRHVGAAAPLGALYEVDTRLRPHGTAGALITTSGSFVEYHCAARETWERQLMTRCRPVFDPSGIGAQALARIQPYLYAAHDADALCREIAAMRLRVEAELGRPRGRWELKRGYGGIMDVDFACHYLQLAHGHAVPELRTCSTREALRAAERAGLLPGAAAGPLREGYEYLRRVETCLRLFDLRNISSFPMEASACVPLARAMGGAAVDQFAEALRRCTSSVREAYLEVISPDF
jgi:glutamate-ammonia-ligase adenylyltransferase